MGTTGIDSRSYAGNSEFDDDNEAIVDRADDGDRCDCLKRDAYKLDL